MGHVKNEKKDFMLILREFMLICRKKGFMLILRKPIEKSADFKWCYTVVEWSDFKKSSFIGKFRSYTFN